jgi:hypothetical protein
MALKRSDHPKILSEPRRWPSNAQTTPRYQDRRCDAPARLPEALAAISRTARHSDLAYTEWLWLSGWGTRKVGGNVGETATNPAYRLAAPPNSYAKSID